MIATCSTALFNVLILSKPTSLLFFVFLTISTAFTILSNGNVDDVMHMMQVTAKDFEECLGVYLNHNMNLENAVNSIYGD